MDNKYHKGGSTRNLDFQTHIESLIVFKKR